MIGFIINFPLFHKEIVENLEPYARRLVNDYQYCRTFNHTKEQIRIFTFNYLSDEIPDVIYENEHWFLFLFGKLYPEQETQTLCRKLIDNIEPDKLEQAFRKISGSFIAFLWDKYTGKYYLITDKICSITAYILKHKNEILISSEWKTFIGYEKFLPIENEESILNTLLFGRVKFSRDSFCKQTFTCPPGSVITITRDGEISSSIYYRYRNDTSYTNQNFDKGVTEGTQKFKELLNDHIQSYQKPALFLSGGIDSRLMAASISEENLNKVLMVSFGMRGNNESFIAREVAEKLNTKYLDIELAPSHFIDYACAGARISEGQDLFAQGYLLYICDQLRRSWNVDSILDGMEIGVSIGGDYLKETYKKTINENLPQRLFEKFYIHKSSPSNVFQKDVLPLIGGQIDKALQDIEDIQDIYDKFDYIFIEHYTREVMRLRHRLIRKSLPDIMLISDSRYLDLATRIPLDFKTGRKFEIAMLEMLNADLTKIRYHKNLMPLNIAHKILVKEESTLKMQEKLTQEVWKNHGVNVPFNHYFTNFSEWFRSDKLMREFINDNLLSQDCHITQNFINKNWMQKIITEHFQGTQDHRTSISYLLSVELFLKYISTHM